MTGLPLIDRLLATTSPSMLPTNAGRQGVATEAAAAPDWLTVKPPA